ncbi:MAG: hypothetical protein ABI091_08860 [Ferruginibacter sp.]
MRYFIFLTLVLSTLNVFSQKTLSPYIEVRGSVDMLGNIYLYNVIKPKKLTRIDSLIDYPKLNAILNLHEPIKVINKLSENGWTLVSVTQVSSDKDGMPNSPFMLYYFKKDFEL